VQERLIGYHCLLGMVYGEIEGAVGQRCHAEILMGRAEARHGQAGHDRLISVRLEQFVGIPRQIRVRQEVRRLDHACHGDHPGARPP
jgi:hypothetical protein